MRKWNVTRNGPIEGHGLARDMEVSVAVMMLAEEIGRVVREAGSSGAAMLGEELRCLADAIATDAFRAPSERGTRQMSLRLATSRVRLAELEARLIMAARAGRMAKGRLRTLFSIIGAVRRHCAFDYDDQALPPICGWQPS